MFFNKDIQDALEKLEDILKHKLKVVSMLKYFNSSTYIENLKSYDKPDCIEIEYKCNCHKLKIFV